MIWRKKNIVSTLTITLVQEDKDLLEQVKVELGQNVATKVFKTLMLYPSRYKALTEELKQERMKSIELEKTIKKQRESHAGEVKGLNDNILEIKNKLQQFFCSFEALKGI